MAAGAALTWGSGLQPATLLVSAFLGWLYAVCQYRTTLLGYLLVGLMYGITLWIVTRLMQLAVVPQFWPVASAGKANFLLCLGFAEALAGSALLASLLIGTTQQTLPKD